MKKSIRDNFNFLLEFRYLLSVYKSEVLILAVVAAMLIFIKIYTGNSNEAKVNAQNQVEVINIANGLVTDNVDLNSAVQQDNVANDNSLSVDQKSQIGKSTKKVSSVMDINQGKSVVNRFISKFYKPSSESQSTTVMSQNYYNNSNVKDISQVALGPLTISTSVKIYEDSVELMAHLISSEGETEPYKGKLAIGSVVMNRVRVDGESIKDVIYKPGAFSGIYTQWFLTEPSGDSYRAAKEVLGGANVVPDAYFYCDRNIVDPAWAVEDRLITRIGDHWFYRHE